jgi:hypothetical protein
MRYRKLGLLLGLALIAAAVASAAGSTARAAAPAKPDISTLAGKVAALRGTAGLQVRFSAILEEEAVDTTAPPNSSPIVAPFVLSSPLDGTSVLPPDVTVNQDTNAAPQNETAIAVDPNNPNRVVAAANDYAPRAWSCTVGGTPCSALGEAYSGTYFSNDGGSTWCCSSSDPSHLGTLIPGINRLGGGQYDAGGDPALAFDSRGNVYYAGLGFDRTAAPDTVAVNKGTFDGNGNLTWGQPVFIDQTSSPSILNDKEWIAADSNPSSPYRDRVYVTFTRYVFSTTTGAYVQSPIMFASSSDGGATFTKPMAISGNAHYGSGSRPVIGPDGAIYVFWDGSTRLASLSSTYVVKSTDGGATWSKPLSISQLTDQFVLADTAFRVNSFPAAAVAPDGTVYATWTTETKLGNERLGGDPRCADWLTSDLGGCYSIAVWSKSTDGGATWSAPQRVFAAGDRRPIGYPVSQPSGGTLDAPDPAGPIEDTFPAVAVGPDGHAYFSAYRGDVVSPWQTCANAPAPPQGRIECDQLGDYENNTRLDYVVTDGTTTQTVSTHPINTRNGFGGGFFGDYTDLAVGPDGTFHAFWTDSNNQQSVTWFYGLEFAPTPINQEDVVTASGRF